jgi:hypothetical protein
MLCPFCLAEVAFTQTRVKTGMAHVCPTCQEYVPALYVGDYAKFPPVVMSAVGYRQHGKTVYFASLFYTLKRLKVATHWPKFLTMSLNEDSLDTVYGNAALLEGGRLPHSTPKNFPRPTLLRLAGVPKQRDATLVCYDTGGECFEQPEALVQYAPFVKRARTVLFLVSVPDLSDPARELHRLLNTYVLGVARLGGDTKKQHLVVVLTKADRLADRLKPYGELGLYQEHGSIARLADPADYLAQMHRMSDRIQEFALKELHADTFLETARDNFATVACSMISALGGMPTGDAAAKPVPRRILDPLLWTLDRSLPTWRREWMKLLLGVGR